MSQSRRILPPGISRKRKEREAFGSFKPSVPVQSSVHTNSKSPSSLPPSNCSNRLLAGYMAHEFLTKGTLLGQKFYPAQAEMIPVIDSLADSRGIKPESEPNTSTKKENRSYAEVASILKDSGGHIPGIVNPTQLARWVQM